MGSRPLQRMNLEPGLQATLVKHNLLTARDVLAAHPVDLVELLDLPHSTVQQLLLQVAVHVAPPFSTAQALRQQQQSRRGYLRTSLPGLDAALRGGVPAAGITELVGPGGVGKSQMCFLLAVLTAMSPQYGGCGQAAILVDTEKKFSSKRILEIATVHMAPACGGDVPAAELEGVMGRILVAAPSSVEELAATLQRLEVAVAQHNAAVVVVDSIAALVRAEYGGRGGVMERQEELGRQAAALKQLAESFHIPIVVTNQVTTRISAPAGGQGQAAAGGSGGGASRLGAALGTKWAHCVNTRLVLERLGDERVIKVAKSPAAANAAVGYRIAAGGLLEVPTSARTAQFLQQSVLDLAIANEIDYGM